MVWSDKQGQLFDDLSMRCLGVLIENDFTARLLLNQVSCKLCAFLRLDTELLKLVLQLVNAHFSLFRELTLVKDKRSHVALTKFLLLQEELQEGHSLA